jgi:hypothetical protein
MANGQNPKEKRMMIDWSGPGFLVRVERWLVFSDEELQVLEAMLKPAAEGSTGRRLWAELRLSQMEKLRRKNLEIPSPTR